MSDAKVTLHAVLNKIQTTVDGGWRITLDLDQGQREEIMVLALMRDLLIKIEAAPVEGQY